MQISEGRRNSRLSVLLTRDSCARARPPLQRGGCLPRATLNARCRRVCYRVKCPHRTPGSSLRLQGPKKQHKLTPAPSNLQHGQRQTHWPTRLHWRVPHRRHCMCGAMGHCSAHTWQAATGSMPQEAPRSRRRQAGARQPNASSCGQKALNGRQHSRRAAAAAPPDGRSVALAAKVQVDVHRGVKGRVACVHAAAGAVRHCAGAKGAAGGSGSAGLLVTLGFGSTAAQRHRRAVQHTATPAATQAAEQRTAPGRAVQQQRGCTGQHATMPTTDQQVGLRRGGSGKQHARHSAGAPM